MYEVLCTEYPYFILHIQSALQNTYRELLSNNNQVNCLQEAVRAPLPKASLPLDQIHHATSLCRLQPLGTCYSDCYGDYVAPQRQLKQTSG